MIALPFQMYQVIKQNNLSTHIPHVLYVQSTTVNNQKIVQPTCFGHSVVVHNSISFWSDNKDYHGTGLCKII